MQVSRRRDRGYRCKRTFHNEHGHPYKPRYSVYIPDPIVIVELPSERLDRDWAFWFCMDRQDGPYTIDANMKTRRQLCEPPLDHVACRFTRQYSECVNGKDTTVLIERDPPELCDAWEQWMWHYNNIYARLEIFK